jgi:hypothetical protein
MSTINEINPNIDQTVQIFDQFYDYSANVPAMEYDIVLSYFRSVFTTTLAAENFTTALFRVAEESDTPALTLLQSMEGQNSIELNISMAYYLNSIRSPATLLGVLTPTTPNFYTARNVRQ